jgi:hypothetical protein
LQAAIIGKIDVVGDFGLIVDGHCLVPYSQPSC